MIDNSKMMIGEHFTYRGIEWICLDIIDGNYLAITAKVWQELPFDFGNHNNWKESSLRRVLNDKFLDKLNKNHLVKQTSDLIADNGDKRYGSCEDYVTILSCDQYRKYRDLIPNYSKQIWTMTPWACSPIKKDAETIRFVSFYNVKQERFSGFGSSQSDYMDLGVTPVCLFSSKHLKLSRQTRLVEIKKGEKI